MAAFQEDRDIRFQDVTEKTKSMITLKRSIVFLLFMLYYSIK